ncbi:MAG: diguanylate cyclase [Actinomycetota bacterium]
MIINKINDAINQRKSLHEVAKLFSSLTRKAFNSYGALVYFLTGDQEYLEVGSLSLEEKTKEKIEEILGVKIPKIKLALSEGNLYMDILNKAVPRIYNKKEKIKEIITESVEAACIEDSLKDKIIPQIYKILDIKSLVSMPVVYREKPIGLVELFSRNNLTKKDLKRFEILCNQFSTAVVQKINEKQLKKDKEIFEVLFNNANDPIFFYRLKSKSKKLGKYIQVNKTACERYGYSKDEFLNLTPLDILDNSSKEKLVFIRNRLISDGHYTYDMVHKLKDGTKMLVEVNSRIFKWQSEDVVMSIVRDITARKKAEDEIKYLSFHDKLTGLYNRDYFEEEIKRLDTRRQLPLCIIMGDVNGLKLINDAFGHTEGDKLLKLAASILEDCLREEDIIARWGGDEFAVLLPRTTRNTTNFLIKRIKDRLLVENKSRIPLSISLGLSIKTKVYQNMNKKLAEAENDMYRVKLAESKEVSTSIIYTLKNSLKDKLGLQASFDHTVAELALKLGKKIKLSGHSLAKINLISSFYDIGMVSISGELVESKKKLSRQEWNLIKKHTEIGYHICIASPQLSHIAFDVLSHHEHWNGGGYPQGLKGENIPIVARIIAIVEAYQKMKKGTPYKAPMKKPSIIKELKKGAGEQFDPNLVYNFIQIIKEE